jgi:glycerophosphoryl diester phosphodiesterase
LENDISSKREYKYRTPIAHELIDEAKNVLEIKYEHYDEHPYLGICINKRRLVFTIDYKSQRKIFFATSETRNGDKIISIPIYVYRLVAETWKEKPEGYTEVHHIINNGYDNTIFNLMWVTHDQHKIIEKRTW